MYSSKDAKPLDSSVVWWAPSEKALPDYGKWIKSLGAQVVSLGTVAQLLEAACVPGNRPRPDILLLGHTGDDTPISHALNHCAIHFPQCPVVVYAKEPSLEFVMQCLRLGAQDVFRDPNVEEEFGSIMAKAVAQRRLTLGLWAPDKVQVRTLEGRLVAHMQSLADATTVPQLLKQCAVIVKGLTQASAAYGWHFYANPQGFERVVELRGVDRALLLEKQAQSLVRDLIVENPAALSPGRPLSMGFLDHQWFHPNSTSAVAVFQSPTGNSAYLVFLFDEPVVSCPIEANPILRQTSRLFHHLDLTLSVSYVDELTGVHNRRFLETVFQQELARQNRYGGLATLLFLDLDHFKDVNDTYGHLVGSFTLREVAQKLKQGLRSSDILARYGGDEFVALMPNTSQDQAFAVAERIRVDLEEMRVDARAATGNGDAHEVSVTASIGLAEFPTCGQSIQDLLALADKAMYSSKSQGKNRVSLAEAMG